MNIIGPDALVFGVDDVDGLRHLPDRLRPRARRRRREGRPVRRRWTARAIVIRSRDDPGLPRRWRCRKHAAPDRLRRRGRGDGPIGGRRTRARPAGAARSPTAASRSTDDHGFRIEVSSDRPSRARFAGRARSTPRDRRRSAASIRSASCRTCRPGPGRSPMSSALYPTSPRPRPFYVNRLGFKVTDRLGNAGPFLRPAGTQDHHTLFFIQTPPHMKGCEHFAFHMGGPTELMLAGTRFIKAGYQSFWGPGRHKFGSNWFWYFNSPLGCHVEYDADMDLHDDEWTPRETPMSAEASQAFLFEHREKWAPGGPPPGAGGRSLTMTRRGSLPLRRASRRGGARVWTLRRPGQSLRNSPRRAAVRLLGRLPALRRYADGLAHERISECGRRPNRVLVPRRGVRH